MAVPKKRSAGPTTTSGLPTVSSCSAMIRSLEFPLGILLLWTTMRSLFIFFLSKRMTPIPHPGPFRMFSAFDHDQRRLSSFVTQPQSLPPGLKTIRVASETENQPQRPQRNTKEIPDQKAHRPSPALEQSEGWPYSCFCFSPRCNWFSPCFLDVSVPPWWVLLLACPGCNVRTCLSLQDIGLSRVL
jgi:hypothetical protein